MVKILKGNNMNGLNVSNDLQKLEKEISFLKKEIKLLKKELNDLYFIVKPKNDNVQEEPVAFKLTKPYIRALIWNTEYLTALASRFVVFEEQKIHKDFATVYTEHIKFTDNNIVWSYDENVACNCHPEYELREKKYPISDFVKWVKEQMFNVEQLTDKDFPE